MTITPRAHTLPNLPQEQWEPLHSPLGSNDEACLKMLCPRCHHLTPKHGHLNKVAYWTARFASQMRPNSLDQSSLGDWGYTLGIWHDWGKLAPQWQAYLASKADPHLAEVTGKLDHATAGAQHAVHVNPLLGHLLAYPIAGHHSGLLDAVSHQACQAARLKKSDLPEIPETPSTLADLAIPPLPQFLQKKRDAFSVSFFTRMLYSCLVDADFLATEAFMNAGQAACRNQTPPDILQRIAARIDATIGAFGDPHPEDLVATQRRQVVEDCRAKAPDTPGFFTLTVPTGGGKTLSSMSFALRHAMAHGQQRVIFVVPFTSIIEQNAAVFRQILEPLQTESFTPLIEHHSSLSPDHESTQSRLASENWDAPIIITTAVQFYESLFAAKTSRSRKLHRIANAVVVLDEAQTLPVDYLAPCLRVLHELCDHYRTTTVLCTATQPAVGYDEDQFRIGLKGAREIIRDPKSLFSALKRVELTHLGQLNDPQLIERLNLLPQVLCIVNRRKHAQELFRLLDKQPGNFHLSALMCPEHRSQILTQIRERLDQGLEVRVISTQLIEAGVDVDFPVVYRSLAGLDSIAQAAGRCNRNGKLHQGETFIFEAEDQRGEAYFRETAQVTKQLLELHDDLLGQEAIHHYFDLYYYQQSHRWDAKNILSSDNFRLDPADRSLPFKFQYASVADEFKLIENRQVPVLIEYNDEAAKLIAALKNPHIHLTKELLRLLQRYTVQVSRHIKDSYVSSFESIRDGQFSVLISKELHYSEHYGLCFDGAHSTEQSLIL